MLTKDEETLIECVYANLQLNNVKELGILEKQVRYVYKAGTLIPMMLFPSQEKAIFPFAASSELLLEDLRIFVSMLYGGENDSLFHFHGQNDSATMSVNQAYIAIVDRDVNVFYFKISRPC